MKYLFFYSKAAKPYHILTSWKPIRKVTLSYYEPDTQRELKKYQKYSIALTYLATAQNHTIRWFSMISLSYLKEYMGDGILFSNLALSISK